MEVVAQPDSSRGRLPKLRLPDKLSRKEPAEAKEVRLLGRGNVFPKAVQIEAGDQTLFCRIDPATEEEPPKVSVYYGNTRHDITQGTYFGSDTSTVTGGDKIRVFGRDVVKGHGYIAPQADGRHIYVQDGNYSVGGTLVKPITELTKDITLQANTKSAFLLPHTGAILSLGGERVSLKYLPSGKILVEWPEGRQEVDDIGDFTIGRAAEDNTIRLSHMEVSRRHARLSVRGNMIILEDLGSTNGVNARPMTVLDEKKGDTSVRSEHDETRKKIIACINEWNGLPLTNGQPALRNGEELVDKLAYFKLGNLEFFYPPAMEKSLIQFFQIRQKLEGVIGLRTPVDAMTRVLIAPRGRYVNGGAADAGGGEILVNGENFQKALSIFVHESTHDVLGQTLGNTRIRTLSEGAAMYFQHLVAPHKDLTAEQFPGYDQVNTALQSKIGIGLSNTEFAERAFGRKMSSEESDILAYRMGAYMAEFIMTPGLLTDALIDGKTVFLRLYQNSCDANVSLFGRELVKDDKVLDGVTEGDLMRAALAKTAEELNLAALKPGIFESNFSRYLELQKPSFFQRLNHWLDQPAKLWS